MNNPQELTEQEKKLLAEARSQYAGGIVNAGFATQSGQDFGEIMGGVMGGINRLSQEQGAEYSFRNQALQSAYQPLTVEQRIAQAVLEERERCAKIADKHMPDCDGNGCEEIALRIRSGE